MVHNPSSDSSLVSSFLAGNQDALDTLIKRYYTRLFAYIYHTTFYKDDDHVEDIRSETVLTIIRELKAGRFRSETEGSFKSWIFAIARNTCINQDRKRREHAHTFTDTFPEDETGLPDDLIAEITPEPDDYADKEAEVGRALAKLKPDEARLLQLVSDGVKYRDILQMPEFRQYTLDYLKLKIYNIRTKMRKATDSTDLTGKQ